MWDMLLASALGGLLGAGIAQGAILYLNPSPPSPTSHVKEPRLVKLVYILADMRGRSVREAEDNVLRVQQHYVNFLRSGIYPVSVGTNTDFRMRDFALSEMFEEAGKELAGRCDGMFLMPGHEQDPENVAVLAYAKTKGVKIFVATEGHIQEKIKAWAVDED
jgi:hypothetical protein